MLEANVRAGADMIEFAIPGVFELGIPVVNDAYRCLSPTAKSLSEWLSGLHPRQQLCRKVGR